MRHPGKFFSFWKSKARKIRYLTIYWLSTSPVSRHNTRLSFPSFVCFLHPAPALWRLVSPKLATSGWSGQTGAMIFRHHTSPVKNIILPSSGVVKVLLPVAFRGAWWAEIFLRKLSIGLKHLRTHILQKYYHQSYQGPLNSPWLLSVITCTFSKAPLPCLFYMFN